MPCDGSKTTSKIHIKPIEKTLGVSSLLWCEAMFHCSGRSKMGDRRWEMGISDFGNRNSDSGKNLSDLGVSAVKPAAAVAVKVNVNVNENLGGGLPATSNPKHATLRSESVATMQTSAGE